MRKLITAALLAASAVAVAPAAAHADGTCTPVAPATTCTPQGGGYWGGV